MTDRRVSVQISASSLAGLGASKQADRTVEKIVDGNVQVALDDGTKVWRPAEDVDEADPWGAEDMLTPLRASNKAGRKLQKAGLRSSRRVSFLRRSNEAVIMSNIEQAEYVAPACRCLFERTLPLSHSRTRDASRARGLVASAR